MEMKFTKMEALLESLGIKKTKASFIAKLKAEAESRGYTVEIEKTDGDEMMQLAGTKIKNSKIMGMTIINYGHVRFEESQLAEHFESEDPKVVIDMYLKAERKGASAVFN